MNKIPPVPKAIKARPTDMPHGFGGVPSNPGMAVTERNIPPAQ
jgi:hypothetical protein